MYTKEDLDSIVSSLNDYISESGPCWKHRYLSEYSSKADTIDKNFRDRIKEAILKDLKPRNSVLSENSNSIFRTVFPHRNSHTILYVDIKKYYDSISYELVEKFLSSHFTDWELDFIKAFYFGEDNKLRRGLFASVFIAEIIGIKIDNIVNKILFQNNQKDKITYTRYYDDMIFSGASKETFEQLEKCLKNELSDIGLTLNSHKTRVLKTNSAKILGLRVHCGEIMTTKRFRNDVRLRIHYADMMVDKFLAGDCNEYEQTLYALGTVIGSLRFIIDNSTKSTKKYKDLLQDYDETFETIRSCGEVVRENEEPIADVDMAKIEKDVLEMISKRRKKRKRFTADELHSIEEIAEAIKNHKSLDKHKPEA